MNYYPFHVGDYAAHTAHLDLLEDLAYRRMLDLYYLRECALPHDPAEVARLIRMRGNVAEVTAVLREFFTEFEGGWVNGRCEEEILRMKDKQTKAKASAEASVAARRAKAEGHRSTPAERTLNERSTDAELPTPTPTPTPKEKHSEAKASGGKPPPMSPDEIIFGYGIPMLTNAGVAEKHARSFLGGLRREHGDGAVIDRLRDCMRAKPLQPLEWLAAALPPNGGKRVGKHAQLESRNAVVVADWQPPELRGVA